MSMDDEIRAVLASHAGLRVDVATIGVHDSLYALGMTSHASVRVMLALEDAFDIEIPDENLRKETLESIGSIGDIVRSLRSVTQS